MTYRLRKVPEAEADLQSAAQWYEDQKPGLGFDFLERVEAAVAVIAQNPFRYGRRFADVHRAPVKRFKFYGVYHFVQKDEIVIISVFSDRRDPERLRERRSQAR